MKHPRRINKDGSVKLGPRQQFTGTNGLTYKLVSKKKAYQEMAERQAHLRISK